MSIFTGELFKMIILVLTLLACYPVHGNALSKEEWQLGPFIKDDSVNPVLEPRNDTNFFCPVRQQYVQWESKDVFNPAALVRNSEIHLLYRAEDKVGTFLGTSRVGLGLSSDGTSFSRSPLPIFYPDNDTALQWEWEGGCEDPRIVEDENGTYFLTYTAYDGTVARLMVASSPDLRSWTKYGPVFRHANDGQLIDLWSKSGAIVTKLVEERFVAQKINGSYYMYWGDTNIFLATSPNLIDWTPVMGQGEDSEKILPIFGPRPGMFDSDLVEPGPQAFITKDGILLIYNSRNRPELNGGDPALPEGTYSAAQILFDAKDPSVVLERAEEYFIKPDQDYEIIGQVNNVVFLEGLVFYKGRFHLYYGTADSKIAVASTPSMDYKNFLSV